MSEPTRDRAAGNPTSAATTTAIIDPSDATLKRRTVGHDVLARDLQAKGIEVTEGRQIGRAEGSVEHVEVFQMGCVGTPIMEDLDAYTDTAPAN